LEVYPNPANATLSIITDVAYTKVKIVNAIGQLQFEKMSVKAIDISGLPNGIYFIQLYDAKQRMLKTKKFVKQ
jgi:hypothetical protein